MFLQSRASNSSVTRRTVVVALGAAAVVGFPELAGLARAQPTDALQAWLAAHAVPVRTVDASDEDFCDLEPLAAAIGAARVVQLGEPSHNAGTCFAAKARLIRFLHQRMGFGVVCWESGLFDVELAEAGLRAGEDPIVAAQRGILRNWSGSEECRPLFAYAQRSHATDHPLTMAGFDSTLTSPFANFAAELRAYAAVPRDPDLRREAEHRSEELIEAFGAVTAYVEALNALNAELAGRGADARQEAVVRWDRETGVTLRPNRAMLERFARAQDRLAGLLREQKAAFAGVEGRRRHGFLIRVVDSLGARAVNLYERFGTDVPPSADGGLAAQNRRDARNADNLRWLIEQAYPGRKLIVWAHNAHIMNAYYQAPEWKTVRLDPAPDTMKPSGVFLAEWLGSDLYTIGFTAYQGDDGWKGLFTSPIPPASENSLEGRLRRFDKPYAFLDLRAARPGGDVPHIAQSMRVPKYDEVEIADPSQPYDGLFFIARMEEATPIPA